LAANAWQGNAGDGVGRKQFFLQKEPKIFINLLCWHGMAAANIKSFLLLFFKKAVLALTNHNKT
jgi:hypothetical protein